MLCAKPEQRGPPSGNRWFESASLQRRVWCEPDAASRAPGFPLVNRFALPPVEESGELVRSMIYRVPVDDLSTRPDQARSAGSGIRRSARVRCAIYTRKSSEVGLQGLTNRLRPDLGADRSQGS
jgi:hypothetical protein